MGQTSSRHAAVETKAGEFSLSFAAPDGYHVNVFGYRALAPTILPHLEKCMELRARRITARDPEAPQESSPGPRF